MNVGTLFAALKLDTNNFEKTLNNAGVRLGRFTKVIAMAGAALAVGVVGAMAASVSAAIDFESAFTGVMKTVDASAEEYAELERGIRDMALEMPLAAGEIAGVAEAAGQLGIENDNILEFSEVMSKLGVTTNLSADEAATALARLANITKMPQENFDRLGSTIVALGNNMATTEAEIVEMGMRIAGAGSQVGMTEAEILSFSAALSSVGIEAAAGGSSISKVMIKMASEVASGGEKLEGFAAVAGLTAEEFRTSFQQNAAGAIVTFIEGLGKMSAEGEDVFTVLDDLGFAEMRVRDALLRASGAGDLFRTSIELGSEAWEENTALTKEAELRFGTTASKIQLMWNRITELAITIGQALLPMVNGMIDAIAGAAAWITTSLLPALGGFGDFIEFIRPGLIALALVITAAMLPALIGMAAAAAAAAAGMIIAFAPVVLVVAGVTAAVVALSAAVNYFAMDFGDMGDRIHKIADQAGEDFNQVKEWIRGYMEETGASFEEAANAADEHFGTMTKSAEELVAEQGRQYEEYVRQTSVPVKATEEMAEGVGGALANAGIDTEEFAAQTGIDLGTVGENLDGLESDFRDMSDTVGEETEEAQDHVITFLDKTIKAIQEAEDPIRQGGQAAADAWLDPIKTAADIAAAEAELGSDELREALRSKDPTIRADAELRTAELTAELIALKNEQALQGDEQAQIAKQKALLVSDYMEEGLASKDPEIRATFAAWKRELELRVGEMEQSARDAKIADELAWSIESHIDSLQEAAERAAAVVRQTFPMSEPKNPNSPFRGITKGWGLGKQLERGIRVSMQGVDLSRPIIEGMRGIGPELGKNLVEPAPQARPFGWGGDDRGDGPFNGRMTVEVRDPDGAIAKGGYDQGQIEHVLSDALTALVSDVQHRSTRTGAT